MVSNVSNIRTYHSKIYGLIFSLTVFYCYFALADSKISDKGEQRTLIDQSILLLVIIVELPYRVRRNFSFSCRTMKIVW